MNKDLLIGKVATILGKSFNEVAFHMSIQEQIEALVKVAEKREDQFDKLREECAFWIEGKSINGLVNQAYQTATSKGWHDEKRETGTLLMLIVGEVAEAMEADRRHEGKDRVTEELADVIIRIFDFCGEKGLDLETAILEKMEFNKTRDYKHGGKAY